MRGVELQILQSRFGLEKFVQQLVVFIHFLIRLRILVPFLFVLHLFALLLGVLFPCLICRLGRRIVNGYQRKNPLGINRKV
ncbi:MAG: hypothetical protein CVU57_23345 [Deltaproteobacteria bacterium HGW-Deltaproteobacteria-15]|nr:MAG: hypothetical protein CVU57_23345 [Deltaproteobacteria bacterium HGW-Deltaproteobacteria-15]